MHFVIVYKVRPEKRSESIDRLLKTGGLPPEGAKMVQRWHDLAGSWGVTVAETENPLSIHKWCMQWNDVLEFEVHQVLSDDQAGPLLAEMFTK